MDADLPGFGSLEAVSLGAPGDGLEVDDGSVARSFGFGKLKGSYVVLLLLLLLDPRVHLYEGAII